MTSEHEKYRRIKQKYRCITHGNEILAFENNVRMLWICMISLRVTRTQHVKLQWTWHTEVCCRKHLAWCAASHLDMNLPISRLSEMFFVTTPHQPVQNSTLTMYHELHRPQPRNRQRWYYYYYYYYNNHFTAPWTMSRLPGWAGTRKVKPGR